MMEKLQFITENKSNNYYDLENTLHFDNANKASFADGERNAPPTVKNTGNFMLYVDINILFPSNYEVFDR